MLSNNSAQGIVMAYPLNFEKERMEVSAFAYNGPIALVTECGGKTLPIGNSTGVLCAQRES